MFGELNKLLPSKVLIHNLPYSFMPDRENRRMRREEEIRRRKEDRKRERLQIETPIARWHRLYAEKARFRERMAPVYNHAVAPIFAGTLSFLNRPELRILVLGGGKGVFSHHLLPEIREGLRQLGKNSKITVIETDLLSIIKHAPADARKVQMDAGKIGLLSETIDLVVGESMIHQGTLEKNLSEIKRVLRRDGYMIHIQDDAPAARSVDLMDEQPIHTKETTDPATMAKKMQDAHQQLIRRIMDWATANNMSKAVLVPEAELLMPRNYRFGTMRGQDLDSNNALYYVNGKISWKKDPSIPEDKRKIVYSGIAVILSKDKVSPLARYLEKIPI